ncbi:MAG: FtsH protease activity modulator HflK [Bradymonadaceae bacterium]|nr:FtsH protease activity modulator HflK [Lujinxingiaceae bacterium]
MEDNEIPNIKDFNSFKDFNNLDFKIKPRVVGIVAVLIVVVIGIVSSFYQVGADSVGVVLRVGKFHGQVGPGLHFKLPFGIDEVHKVPTEKQLKEEFGFRTTDSSGANTRYSSADFSEESLMLTGDLNVVEVQWTIQYRISDPFKFLFRVRNVHHTLRFMTQAVMREVVGDRTVHEVLTVGRTELATSVHTRLQELCNQYEMGITVGQVILQDITPPDPVKPSFNEVNQAQQEMEKMINQARTEYNAEIPRARGIAQQLLQQAEGYEINRVNRAEGEAARFNSLYQAYTLAPEVTRRRIYIETMAEVLPQVKHKILVDEKATGLVPLLQLGASKKEVTR